jgi:hypothetical protein
MRNTTTLLLVAGLLLPTAVAHATEYSIGTVGASVDLDSTWNRRMFNPDLGDDQFINDAGVFMVILEDRSLLESRADLERTIYQFSLGIEQRSESYEAEEEILFERVDGVVHGRQRIRANAMGLSLIYRLDVVSRDGLTLILMSFSEVAGAVELETAMGGLPTSISWPGPETEWGRLAERQPRTFRFGDWAVTVPYRESVFPVRNDMDGDGYHLGDRDDSMAFRFFMFERQGRSVEDSLEDIVATVNDDGSWDALWREEVQAASGGGLQSLLRAEDGPLVYEAIVAAIDVGDDMILDLRLVTVGDDSHREMLWEALLDGIEVTAPVEVDAFPVVEDDGVPDDELSEGGEALFAASTLVGASDSWNATTVSAGDGSVLVLDGQRLVRFRESPEDAEVLHRSREWITSWSLAWDGSVPVVIARAEAGVHRVVDGELVPVDVEADRIAGFDGGVVTVESPDPPTLVGLQDLPPADPVTIVFRDNAGARTREIEIADGTVLAIAAARDGERVALAVAPVDVFGRRALGQPIEVVEIREGSSRRRSLGLWDRVTSIAPADGDWLVNGTPVDGATGVYRSAVGDAPELLIAGDATGIDILDGEVFFASDVCRENAESMQCIYRAPIEAVRDFGPRFEVLSVGTLNAIAREIADREDGGVLLVPTTAQEMEAAVRVASETMVRVTGEDLPATTGEIDAVLDAVLWNDDLSPDGLSLLSLMFTNVLLESGASWVDAKGVGPSIRSSGNGIAAQNAFAIGIEPHQVVAATLYSEEGWWRAASEVEDLADGRTLLLGNDADALARAVEGSADDRVLEAMEEQRWADLPGLLAEHATNHSLRARVYSRLASLGEIEAMGEVAAAFVDGETAGGADLVGWLAARLDGLNDDQDPAALVTDLRDAIQRFPEEAPLYLILGVAYERTSGEQRLALARACYSRVLEIQTWGDVANHAEEALNRLDEGL